ncbi:MAG: hypothetical protein A2Y16_03370 [Tenericutes bacterium GWF2_57_13]|nr:MAG: hypothetical protein A2Y16_03370 [Tenericutes bacterium GWF2_57_13]
MDQSNGKMTRTDICAQLFKNHPDIIYLIDPETSAIIECNEAACNFYGYSHEAMLTKHASDINTLGEEQIAAEIVLALLQKQKQFYFKHRLADGSIRNVSLVSSPLTIDAKALLFVTVRDITDEIAVTEEQTRDTVRLEAMIADKTYDLEQQLGYQNAMIESIPGLWYVFERTGLMIRWNKNFETITGYTPDELKRMTIADFFSPADVLRVDAAIERIFTARVADLEAPFRLKSGEMRVFRFTGVPLFLNQVAYVTGVGMDVTLQRADEQKLRESEALMNLFFQQSLTGFFIMMLDNPIVWDDSVDKEAALDELLYHQRVTNVNQAMLAQYGMAREQFLNKTPADLFAHNLAQGRDVFRTLFDRGRLHVYTDERDADGKSILIEGDYICLYDAQGSVIGHFGNQLDVTERIASELEVKRAHTLLRSSLESPKDLIILAIDKNYDYLYFNQAHKTVMKHAYGTDITIGSNLLSAVTSEIDRINSRKNYDLAMTGVSHTTVEEYGDVVVNYYESYYNPIRDDDGNIIGATAFARDITERITEQHRLRDSEARLSEAQEITHLGSWDLLLGLNRVWASAEAYRIYGIAQNAAFLPLESVQALVLPPYRAAMDAALRDLIAANVKYDIEFGIRRADNGKISYIRSVARLIRDDANRPIKIVGTIQDITERKMMEMELQKEKETVLATLQSIGDGVISTDASGVITALNLAAETITGWKNSDAVGKPFDSVFHVMSESTRIIAVDPIQRVLDTKQSFELSNHTILTAKDGTEHYIEDCASPIKDKAGAIIGVVLVFRDVTEKKQHQREIEHLASHDYLTGLHNRRHYVEAFETLNHPEMFPLGIMMLDVNGLKIINDAYGHDIGDIALKAVADFLRETFRAEDVVARIGGDEFAVLLPCITDEELHAFKTTIRDGIALKIVMNVPLSLAVGYEAKTVVGKSLDEMLKTAENHMYRHKLAEGVGVRNRAIKAILNTLTEKYVLEKNHSELVSRYCVKIGEAMGLPQDDLKELAQAGLYHDIGKISLPDNILNKPSALTADEYDTIKTHAEIGYQILRAADEYSDLAIHALYHHERWDGTGYPTGLAGTAIPLFSRIIGVADAFEAMTADRPYRNRMSEAKAVKEIAKCAGTQFDPEIADVFVRKVLGND